MNASSQTRFVGIRPRVKMSADGEPRPTQVVIIVPNGFNSTLDLETEQDELDFVLGTLPLKWRKVAEGEDLSRFPKKHVKLGKDDKPEKVPVDIYDGLRPGDVVAMAMGGSGDYFAFALSRQGEKIGAIVERIPPFVLKAKREEAKLTKDDDAKLLAELVQTNRELFTPVMVRDRKIVLVRELQRLRDDTLKARMGCASRLRQRFIGRIFCDEGAGFPEGKIEDSFDAQKANDKVLTALLQEESRTERELAEAVEATDVWQRVFEPLEGVGPKIAARLISAIGDIRRFATAPKLTKYCGAHCEDDGRFARRRNNQVANWSGDARQALFLLSDQWNRRPDSEWGKILRANKIAMRQKHPAVVIGENGKKKFTDGHIHKMAIWRTITQFVHWLFAEWWKMEREIAEQAKTEKAA